MIAQQEALDFDLPAQTPVRLPGVPTPKLAASWGHLRSEVQRALLPHLLGGTSADTIAGWFTRAGHPVGATTVKSYRRNLRQSGELS